MINKIVLLGVIVAGAALTTIFQNCSKAQFKNTTSQASASVTDNTKVTEGTAVSSGNLKVDDALAFNKLKFENRGRAFTFADIIFIAKTVTIDLGRKTMDLGLKLRNGDHYAIHGHCDIDAERASQIDEILRTSSVCANDGSLAKGMARTALYIEPDLILSEGEHKSDQEVAISTNHNGAHLFLCARGEKIMDHAKTDQIKLVLESLAQKPPAGCAFERISELKD